MMKNILLTGSSGFIGSYFMNKYQNKYNIEIFSFRNDDFENLNLDIIDTVVHLSALVHQMGGATKEEYEKINVSQTLDLAKKAKEGGVEHFIFMSTIKVYGEETDVAYSEDTICKPQDEYGVSKLKAENKLLEMQDDNFKVSIIRTPIVYGYGVKANIKNLINLVKKVPILPFSGINNKRSMIYVGNLCCFIDEIIKQRQSGIFCVSDGRPLSTTQLTKLIAKNLDKKLYLVKIPFFGNLLKLIKPSFHKRLFESLEVENAYTLKKLFGDVNIQLPYSVEDGIKFMINGEDF